MSIEEGNLVVLQRSLPTDVSPGWKARLLPVPSSMPKESGIRDLTIGSSSSGVRPSDWSLTRSLARSTTRRRVSLCQGEPTPLRRRLQRRPRLQRVQYLCAQRGDPERRPGPVGAKLADGDGRWHPDRVDLEQAVVEGASLTTTTTTTTTGDRSHSLAPRSFVHRCRSRDTSA